MTTIVFDLHSWWHAGTGRGLGAVADAVVNRTPEGLPYLPGRSVKGLVRSAVELAQQCKRVPEGRATLLFGTPLAATASKSDDDDVVDHAFEEGRYQTDAGCLRFGSAVLGADWTAWARRVGPADPHLAHLFHLVASTSVKDDGQVEQHTLRTIEVALPVRLVATVDCVGDDQGWLDDLRKAVPLIRSVGAHRNRGLGRVTARIGEVS